MKTATTFVLAASLAISGCASIEMASSGDSDRAKQFDAPSHGTAGVYLYRDSILGPMLKKDLWVNGKCIGETAPNMFFYTELEGDRTHRFDTESEFSPNTLELMLQAGKNYFIRQFIKLGLFVGGAGLELVSEEQGKAAVAKLEMGIPGKCSAAETS